MSIKVHTDLKKVAKKMDDIGKSDKVGKFYAEEVYRLSEPYVPMDTGMLYQTATREPWVVTYTTVYARRLYYGDDFNFSRDKHRLATSRWDIAMFQAREKDLAKSMTEFIKNL